MSLKEEVAKVNWFHSIDLGNGIITPGKYDTSATLRTLNLPSSFQGKTVLDIGAWDGFYSFEAERRGAKRVLATDHFCWSGPGWGSQAGFNLARKALNSKVEDYEIDVMDLSPEKIGTFDVVLFLGVLYHLRHPLLALERVFSVTKELLILETDMDKVYDSRPVMVFYPGGELDNDPTNWWGPNPAAVTGMLKTAGFSRVETVTRIPPLPRKIYWDVRFGVTQKGGKIPRFQRMRGVFHAWR